MSSFGQQPPYKGEREVKEGKVTGLKSSYKKGHKKVVVRERSAPQKTFTVDIPFKDSKDIKRKESYSFNVYEEDDSKSNRFGGNRNKAGSIKSYMSDEAPTEYQGRGKANFKNFGSDDSDSSSRIKF